MRTRLLYMMMQNSDRFFSGEQLAEQFGVTRAAIWKNIEALKKIGCEFESKQNKGYRLTHIPDALAPEILGLYDFANVTERLAIKKLDVVDSTNRVAKTMAGTGTVKDMLIMAETQTDGKGRMGRIWFSEDGKSLVFSLLLFPHIPPADASKIALIAGLSMAETIRTMTGLDALVKWPNDVLINGKKVCGILMEMGAQIDRTEYVICGVGLNVNNRAFDASAGSSPTSLFLESGQEHSRTQLLVSFLADFYERFDAWYETGDFVPVISEYTRLNALQGKTVSVEFYGQKTAGEVLGFDKDGYMVIGVDGKKKRVMAGDISYV